MSTHEPPPIELAAIETALASAQQRAIVEHLNRLGSPACRRTAEVMERILTKLDQQRSQGGAVPIGPSS